MPQNTTQLNTPSPIASRANIEAVKADNSILFKYDPSSDLKIDDFNGFMTITDVYLKFSTTVILHTINKNDNMYYSIYSLKDNHICYVFFRYSPNTGVDFYFEKAIEYPNDYSSNIRENILEQDYPEKILK